MTEQRIRIQLPLGVDIVSSLVAAMGAMYPNAKIRTDDSRHLTIVIDDADRRPRLPGKKELAKAKMTSDAPELDSDVVNFEDGTVSLTVPEALQELAVYALTILTLTPGVINYVEQEMTHNGKRMHFSVSWTKDRSPHEMRKAAEARVAELEARIAELESARTKIRARRRTIPREVTT